MIKKSLLVLISLLVIPSLSVKAEESAHEASFYEKLKDNLVRCRLCPRECTIADGKRGYCRVRQNRKGALYALSYAQPVAIHIDPIEKNRYSISSQALRHFLLLQSAVI